MNVTNEMREAVLREIVSPTNARMAATEQLITAEHRHVSAWNTLVAGLHRYADERGVDWSAVTLKPKT